MSRPVVCDRCGELMTQMECFQILRPIKDHTADRYIDLCSWECVANYAASHITAGAAATPGDE